MSSWKSVAKGSHFDKHCRQDWKIYICSAWTISNFLFISQALSFIWRVMIGLFKKEKMKRLLSKGWENLDLRRRPRQENLNSKTNIETVSLWFMNFEEVEVHFINGSWHKLNKILSQPHIRQNGIFIVYDSMNMKWGLLYVLI